MKQLKYSIAPTGGPVTQKMRRRQAAQRHSWVRDAHRAVYSSCCHVSFLSDLFFCPPALKDDIKQIPVIPGFSSGTGTMIYAGSIGTQIANELIDSYR